MTKKGHHLFHGGLWMLTLDKFHKLFSGINDSLLFLTNLEQIQTILFLKELTYCIEHIYVG